LEIELRRDREDIWSALSPHRFYLVFFKGKAASPDTAGKLEMQTSSELEIIAKRFL
jgi:hypothetical protein